MNRYEVVLHFPSGHDIKVVALGANMDEAIASAKRTEDAHDSIASTTRRID